MPLKILIIENDPLVARNIESSCRSVIGSKIESVQIIKTLKNAYTYLLKHPIDLCILDPDPNGKKGFRLLDRAVSGSFQTIIISGYSDLAIEAFKYDVLDFIPKPLDEERLRLAFNKYTFRLQNSELATKCLPVRRGKENYLVFVNDIEYIKADRIYVEVHLRDGTKEILNKSMDRLEQIRPSRFIRIHRSYIVDVEKIEAFKHLGSGKYQIRLRNKQILPLSRHRYKALQNILAG